MVAIIANELDVGDLVVQYGAPRLDVDWSLVMMSVLIGGRWLRARADQWKTACRGETEQRTR
jgi:hypothetical protein